MILSPVPLIICMPLVQQGEHIFLHVIQSSQQFILVHTCPNMLDMYLNIAHSNVFIFAICVIAIPLTHYFNIYFFYLFLSTFMLMHMSFQTCGMALVTSGEEFLIYVEQLTRLRYIRYVKACGWSLPPCCSLAIYSLYKQLNIWK